MPTRLRSFYITFHLRCKFAMFLGARTHINAINLSIEICLLWGQWRSRHLWIVFSFNNYFPHLIWKDINDRTIVETIWTTWSVSIHNIHAYLLYCIGLFIISTIRNYNYFKQTNRLYCWTIVDVDIELHICDIDDSIISAYLTKNVKSRKFY